MLPGNQILKSLALRAKVELDNSSVSSSGENVKHSVWSVRIEMPKHIVIWAAAGSRAHEGHIEHKKGSTGTVLNMEENSPQVTPEAPQRANASNIILANAERDVNSENSNSKDRRGVSCRDGHGAKCRAGTDTTEY